VTFDDGSSDTIQFSSAHDDRYPLYGWTIRRNGRKKYSGLFTMITMASYLYQLAYRGENVDDRFDLDGPLQKAYQKAARDAKK
jgi:hypothetical protein